MYGGTSGPVEIWDAESGIQIRHFKERAGVLCGLAFTSDRNIVISTFEGDPRVNRITVWDTGTGLDIATYPLSAGPIPIGSFDVSNDGRFVCCTENREVHFLSLEGTTRS